MIRKAWLLALTFSVVGLTPTLRAELGNRLTLAFDSKILRFELRDAEEDKPWVLQHSSDGEIWKDVIFLEKHAEESRFTVELNARGISKSPMKSGFFRAIQLPGDDSFYRGFLEARVRWAVEGFESYVYEVTWNWSMFTWQGRVTVVDGVVTGTETIMSFPEEIGPLDDLTIDDWFEKVKRARDQDVDQLDVVWDKTLGFPAFGFIDVSFLIADEEQSWTINKVTPLDK